MKHCALALLFSVLLCLLCACADQTTTAAGPNTITMSANTFSTNAIMIKLGEVITFVSNPAAGSLHILVIGRNGSAEQEKGAPDFGKDGHTLQPGDTWKTPPWEQAGTYHVTCTLHPDTMNLTVKVTG